MRTISKDVFQYDELNDKAKEKARDWYKQNVACSDSSWFEGVYIQAEAAAVLLGILLDSKRGNMPTIYFNGFWSQGNGACFEGSYSYAKGSVQAISKEFPQDIELQRIAKELQTTQRRNFYKLACTMKHRGHYYHSGCMSVDVHNTDSMYRDIGDAEDEITQSMRDFADWIYKRLEDEQDYLTSDEQVIESLQINEYEFDIEGNIV
jgi:hypothetical protein